MVADERADWLDKLRKGEIPEDIQRTLNLFRDRVSDPSWRSSRAFEHLLVCAIVLEEDISNE